MKNISIWKNDIKPKNYPELKEDIKVDVLIIGGGITGISTLYHLKKSNLKVTLVDQNQVGMGVTSNSTGKLTYLQNDLIDKIRNNFNDKIALKYIKSQQEGIKTIKDIANKEQIDCDLQKVTSYLYTNKDEEIKRIKNLEQFLKNNNIKVYKDDINIVKSKYMIAVKDTYQFNPLKFIYNLLKKDKYNIYERTSIKRIKYSDNIYSCYTDKNEIKAKWVVIASHYPYFNLPFLFPIKASLEKSYLSASKHDIKPLSLISYSYPFISIRNYKDYLIYLSNSHPLNKDVSDKKNYDELLEKLSDLNLKPDFLWSNIDIITNDGLPYIGKLKDNLLMGTGYNTWGLSTGILSGKIMSDIILGKENEYEKLFLPQRLNLNKVTGMFSDIGKSIQGYIEGFKHKSGYKCPHLGCDLIFNEIDKTYDCPCHGSRFYKNGKVISGPANRDIHPN